MIAVVNKCTLITICRSSLSFSSFLFLCENDAPNEKRIISTQEVCGYQQKMYNFPVADDLA